MVIVRAVLESTDRDYKLGCRFYRLIRFEAYPITATMILLGIGIAGPAGNLKKEKMISAMFSVGYCKAESAVTLPWLLLLY